MAKRPQPKSKDSSPTPSPAATTQTRATEPSPYSGPPKRTTYFEAVAVYEKGVEALQRHDYPQALELLQSVLKRYPEEKELHERVRLYLNICERHATPTADSPQTIEERLYASTLAINGGRYDEAISHLRLVRDEDPDNEHALYMLAVAHAQRGEHAQALAHLERSIVLNPENRALARRDPDLEPLRADESFRLAIEPPPSAAFNGELDAARRNARPKSAR